MYMHFLLHFNLNFIGNSYAFIAPFFNDTSYMIKSPENIRKEI